MKRILVVEDEPEIQELLLAYLRGADLQISDYVTKPFSVTVLLWKIAAVLRRTSGEEGRPLQSREKELKSR